METAPTTLTYPENIPGIRLLREDGTWKYIDLQDGVEAAALEALLAKMPRDHELCFFDYRFGERMGDMNGLYVMLQVYEGFCYFWKGNHGRTSELERFSIPEAAEMIGKNIVQEDAFLYLVPTARRFETRPDFRWHKAPERAKDGQGELMRHALATLAYRFHRAVKGMGEEFGELQVGQAVRKPIEILHHMREVMEFTASAMTDAPRPELPMLTWNEEVDGFHDVLGRLDKIFLEYSPNEMLYKKLFQGPLSDVLTHVGQLSMLRRIFGKPVAGISFFKAEIRTGNTSPQSK